MKYAKKDNKLKIVTTAPNNALPPSSDSKNPQYLRYENQSLIKFGDKLSQKSKPSQKPKRKKLAKKKKKKLESKTVLPLNSSFSPQVSKSPQDPSPQPKKESRQNGQKSDTTVKNQTD